MAETKIFDNSGKCFRTTFEDKDIVLLNQNQSIMKGLYVEKRLPVSYMPGNTLVSTRPMPYIPGIVQQLTAGTPGKDTEGCTYTAGITCGGTIDTRSVGIMEGIFINHSLHECFDYLNGKHVVNNPSLLQSIMRNAVTQANEYADKRILRELVLAAKAAPGAITGATAQEVALSISQWFEMKQVPRNNMVALVSWEFYQALQKEQLLSPEGSRQLVECSYPVVDCIYGFMLKPVDKRFLGGNDYIIFPKDTIEVWHACKVPLMMREVSDMDKHVGVVALYQRDIMGIDIISEVDAQEIDVDGVTIIDSKVPVIIKGVLPTTKTGK